MTDAMINNAKRCLKNLTKCEEIYHSEDPMGDFGNAILNCYQHYTDNHSSIWCRFYKQVNKTAIDPAIVFLPTFLSSFRVGVRQGRGHFNLDLPLYSNLLFTGLTIVSC